MPLEDRVVVAIELGEVLVVHDARSWLQSRWVVWVHDEGAGCRADGWSGFIRVRKGGLVRGLGS